MSDWGKSAVEVIRLTEVSREKLRVNPRESLRIAEDALSMAQELGQDAPLARALRAKANALWFLNRNRSSIALYRRSVAVFEKLGDLTEVGRTLSSSIQPLIRLGRYAKAMEGARRAREIFRSTEDALRLARLDLNVANILHRQDRFGDALEIYERTYRELLPYKDTEGIAVALHNMAVCLIALNDFPRALSTYRAAKSFYRAHDMPALVAQADYNIAYLQYLRGHYSRALELLSEAHQAAEAAGDSYHCALCSLDQSEVYLELNMDEQAAGAARKAAAGFRELLMGYETAKSLANLAIAEGRLGRAAQSIEIFAQARRMFVREKNLVWPSLLDLYQALVLHAAGRDAEAQPLAEAALDFFRGRNMPAKQVLCELVLSRIFLRAGDTWEAREYCSDALDRVEELDAPHLEWQAHLQMGRIAEAANDLAEAGQHYELARRSAESLRGILRGDELKIAFMKDKLEIYQSLVRLCFSPAWGVPRLEEAFAHMEQAKSRSLCDLLAGCPRAEDPARTGPPLSPDARQIRELREDLNWYYHRIELEEAGEDLPSADRVAELRACARQRENKLLELFRNLPAAEADRTGISAVQPFALDYIRGFLGPNTALVEYFRLGEQIIAAVVTASSIDVARLAPVSRVNELVRLLLFQISKFRLSPEYVESCGPLLLEAARSHLRDLYDELLRPLSGLPAGGHVIFVPHDALHQVPLHALFDGEAYVIDRYTVSYAPSASIYALCAAQSPRQAGVSLVMGVPDGCAPFIPNEVRSVARILPNAELYLGETAARQVLAERGPSARLLHIASHGRFREDAPLFSAIELGDGRLTLFDLQQMRLPVDLAAISGCGTGLSAVAGGDELLGLVRGFLRAGAASLLLSLWDVHDRTTAQFMSAFYSRYLACGNKAAAVQHAMLQIRERHPHPYYWAPFVLIGKP